ncbi:MAG: hypothetical protein RLY32_870 [Pseudomonadota bacterium]
MAQDSSELMGTPANMPPWGLEGKRILVAVSAGVAAYKTCILVRELMRAGAKIKIVMTESARAFVSAETFQALSGEPVYTDLWDDRISNRMAHIELGRWADAIIIAPASADLMARLAHGICNDLLSTLCLARPRDRCLLLIAPAMNKEMWSHPATQRNAATLEQDGTIFLGPDRGDQACGETGDGRMLEPEDLLQALEHALSPKFLAGRHCLITAGPTFEAIDPVRGITNRSSGKMGFAIARAASQAGALVHLIAGPVSLKSPWQVHRTDVVSALDMKQAVDRALESMQNSVIERSIFISVAAVADWRPAEIASQKIKKQRGASTPSLRFVENPDILAGVAARSPRPFCVGFAAESEMLHEHGEAKRKKKNIPMLAANIGHDTFGQDLNQLLLLDAQGSRSLPLATKEKLAQQLIEAIASDLS